MDPAKTTAKTRETDSAAASESATTPEVITPTTTPATPATSSGPGKVRVTIEKGAGLATRHDEMVKKLRRFVEFQAQRFVIEHEVKGELSLLVYASLEK